MPLLTLISTTLSQTLVLILNYGKFIGKSLSLLNHTKFQTLLERNAWETIVKRLVPLLDTFAKQDTPVDLQDIFQRLNFDTISKLLLDHDPKSLSINLPHVPCKKAFNDMIDAILYRHFLPESYWKLQRWLRIGKEKNLMKAWEAFDQYIYPAISRKMSNKIINGHDFDFFTDYVKACNQWKNENNDNNLGNVQDFLRDTFLNLMFAGRDTISTTLTCFFWLMAKIPLVEKKIIEEIQQQLHLKRMRKSQVFQHRRIAKIGLSSAFCEALRLFPSVAIEHKAPVDHDILPSGHRVSPNKKILLSFITMERMESIWGKDCLEFKPKRWITERRGPNMSHLTNFQHFAKSRTCVGKEMAFIQMKMVAATIIYNYQIQLLEAQTISPTATVVIRMTNGLKVRLSKRVPI